MTFLGPQQQHGKIVQLAQAQCHVRDEVYGEEYVGQRRRWNQFCPQRHAPVPEQPLGQPSLTRQLLDPGQERMGVIRFDRQGTLVIAHYLAPHKCGTESRLASQVL